MHSCAFLLALLVTAGVYAGVPTQCETQLYNYYVGLGVPMLTPVQLVINFTSGVLLGVPFVSVQFLGQKAARFYDTLLPSPPVNLSDAVYFTIDLPWCATNIDFKCLYNATIGTVKTTNCTTISDFDLGPPNVDAGRLFVYSNQTAPCNGIPTLTFFNVTLSNSSTDTYTYDLFGIRNQVMMNWQTASNTYRASYCDFTDGSPASLVNQQQFVCTEPQMLCNATRTTGTPTLEVIPTPQFACIGRSDPNSSVVTVKWKVSNFLPPSGVQGAYGAFFTTSTTNAISLEIVYATSGQQYLLIPGTVRQFDSLINSMDQYGAFFYQGHWTLFQPTYALSNDPFTMRVPCLCGFSMFCDANGIADVTSVYTGFVRLNNVLPICNPGPDQQIGFGTPEFVINANESYDPDNAPYPFNVLWEVLSTPYDPNPPPFNLTNPTAFEQTINSTGLQLGTYLFLLYASDLQSQVPCVVNVTILPNQVFAIVEYDFIVPFLFYSGAELAHPCSTFPPQPSIPVNGNYSYATNPSSPFYYNWTQTGGFPLTYSCDPTGFTATAAIFNTTTAFLQFVPPVPGTYCFELTVTDNITNSSAIVCVTVTPDFRQPNSTLTPITNFTPPPIRNLTQPTRPILTFPPYILPPFNTQPPFPVTPPTTAPIVPPLIPVVPPLTYSDYIIIWVWVAVILAFFLFFLAMYVLYSDENRFRVMEKRQYGGRANKVKLN